MAKYKIKKGQHYNASKVRFFISLLLGLINGEVLRRTFMLRFGKNMERMIHLRKEDWYPKDALDKGPDGKPLTGWNKLVGFTGFMIHSYSARLCWQPDFENEGWFDIVLYVHNDEAPWLAKNIMKIKGDKVYKGGVTVLTEAYEGYVYDEDTKKSVIITSKKTPHFIRCEPYFGGQSVAPKEIVIRLWSVWWYKVLKYLGIV